MQINTFIPKWMDKDLGCAIAVRDASSGAPTFTLVEDWGYPAPVANLIDVPLSHLKAVVTTAQRYRRRAGWRIDAIHAAIRTVNQQWREDRLASRTRESYQAELESRRHDVDFLAAFGPESDDEPYLSELGELTLAKLRSGSLDFIIED